MHCTGLPAGVTSALPVLAVMHMLQVWSVGASGDRYQRWWGEQHLGDRRVRRHGHSTTGEGDFISKCEQCNALLSLSAFYLVSYYA